MHIWLKRFAFTVMAAGFAVAMSTGASYAAKGFAGTWKVKDSTGHRFEIVLLANGKAKAKRENEGMTGHWRTMGKAAVIHWRSGWTTMIVKKKVGYRKEAWANGHPLSGPPTNKSRAHRVK